MSDATVKWRAFYDDDASKHVICEKANVLVIIAELDREEDADTIVRDHNAHDALVAALEKIAHDENTSYLACPGPPHCDKSHYPTCPVQIARAALEAVDSRNGEAKR